MKTRQDLTVNQRVVGSSPAGGANKKYQQLNYDFLKPNSLTIQLQVFSKKLKISITKLLTSCLKLMLLVFIIFNSFTASSGISLALDNNNTFI